MVNKPKQKWRYKLTGVDIVAIILAVGVALVICLIIIGTIVQILNNSPGAPDIQLSENATQILIAGIGGMIGVLGGYIGYRMHGNTLPPQEVHMNEEREEKTETMPENPPPAPGQPAPDTTPPTSPTPGQSVDPESEDDDDSDGGER